MITTKKIIFSCCGTNEAIRVHANEVPRLVCNNCGMVGKASIDMAVLTPPAKQVGDIRGECPAAAYAPVHGGYPNA